MLLRNLRFIWLRMCRAYVVFILLLVVPLCVIVVWGVAVGSVITADTGMTGMDWFAVSMVLSFQLFGGAYTMSYIQQDLLSARKWRIYSLPYPVYKHAYTLLIASTLFSVLQGLILVVFTYAVFGVNWGHWGWVLLVLFSVSLLSQLVCLILALSVRNFKLAERLSEVYGVGSVVWAGLFFPLPDHAFFAFMGKYGNPVSLGQNVIFGLLNGCNSKDVYISLVLLWAASATLGVIAVLLGRRKLI